MSNILRNGALALALLAGAAFAAAPAMAGSKYGKNHSGKSWNKHGYNNAYRKHNRSAGHYYGPRYRSPGYAYYGPGAYYGSPYNYGPRSGLSITIR